MDQKITEEFNKEYYCSDVWNFDRTTFMGVTVFQNPADMWVMQELIWKVKPTLIIETGTARGGSALYMSVVLDCLARCGMGKGRIVSIDIEKKKKKPASPIITYVEGCFSIDPQLVFDLPNKIINPEDKVMVVLDSDHTEEHVLREMEVYGEFVSVGSYMVVNDTNITIGDTGRGPADAVSSYLKEHDEFVIDRGCEKFGLTFNPGGYLRRIK